MGFSKIIKVCPEQSVKNFTALDMSESLVFDISLRRLYNKLIEIGKQRI